MIRSTILNVQHISLKVLLIFLFIGLATQAFTQPLQDSTLNNLVLPANFKTCESGTLGEVKKFGGGKQSIILVPGIGFGWQQYKSIISYYQSRYSVYAITPAGFNGTASPAMPDTSVKYDQLTWTNGIVTGILNLIEKEQLNKPIIIAHFVTGTQVGFNLSINHADKIGKVIIIGGAPYRYYATPRNNNWNDLDWEQEKKLTAEQRSFITESWIAPKWFKTVTKKTWDDNMWTPDDYCRSKSDGEKLFRVSAEVPVQIMIRYLIEWGTYDASDKYSQIKSPMLMLIPDFNGVISPDPEDSLACKNAEAKKYLNYYHKDIWKQAEQAGNPLLRFITIPDTRIYMWYDKPKETFKAIDDFLK